ncbi:nuclear transport factor 2 family protein [Paraburkholderia sacchari]|uniref:Nuclear transport factor 2 family protein n=1 Tax=Paraburkholderia sacchari TaxID=159450 RepID=A0A8T6ZHX7_9BURK|nr:nuclear transport factor 2 family protein [Paraburkholderia sacchari]NLP64837.1 nuclear transport factor 2 family protein [Paraburkholderia sacchari]
MTADDYIQIQNLVHRYAYLIDSGRWKELGDLFADADVYIAGELAVHRDPEKLEDLWRQYVRLYANGTPKTHHVITNLTIEEVGPEEARTHCYVLVVQQTAALPLQPIITGDYLDRFVKSEGKWRFAERRIANDLIGDLSAHLLQELAQAEEQKPQSW